jgi:hypothetical protein
MIEHEIYRRPKRSSARFPRSIGAQRPDSARAKLLVVLTPTLQLEEGRRRLRIACSTWTGCGVGVAWLTASTNPI